MARSFSICKDMVIRCPPNINGEKRCFIQGDNNFRAVTIYATYSWNDVDFDAYFGTLYGTNSTMYCGVDYTESCDMSDTEWNCANQTSFCQDPPTLPPFPTMLPTLNPRQKPTT
eukprot:799862_1